jgi:hypothetical protein
VAGGKPRRPIPSTRRVRPGGKEEVSVLRAFLLVVRRRFLFTYHFSGAVAVLVNLQEGSN